MRSILVLVVFALAIPSLRLRPDRTKTETNFLSGRKASSTHNNNEHSLQEIHLRSVPFLTATAAKHYKTGTI